jgi:hypothetical protein
VKSQQDVVAYGENTHGAFIAGIEQDLEKNP